MSENKRFDVASVNENIISFRSKAGAPKAPSSLNDVEAFCIRTEEIYYITLIYQDKQRRFHSHGHAVFKDGEKVKFTIAANGDETVREKCILAGHSIAEKFGGTLIAGKIDEYGRFHRNMDEKNEEEIVCGKNYKF